MSQFYVQYAQRGRLVSKGQVAPVYYVLVSHPTLGVFRENRETMSVQQVEEWMGEVPVDAPEWTPLDDLQRWRYCPDDQEQREAAEDVAMAMTKVLILSERLS